MSWQVGGEKRVIEMRIIIDVDQPQLIQSIAVTPGLYQDFKNKGVSDEMIFDFTEKIRVDLTNRLNEILFCKV